MGKMLRKAPDKNAGNRKKKIAVLILAAAVILIGSILFFQISEVADSKGFWDNFKTSQQG